MVKFDHLRINCQKILPAVYGDSLSYYETLCKLQKAVNDLVEYLASYEDEILMKHLRDLKNYIDRELSMIQGQLDLVKSDLQGVKQTISINMQTINAKIAQIELDLAQKQNQYAPGLATVNKTIEGAINELYAILLTKYTFPDGGIPLEDLSPELQQLLEEIPYLLIDKADVIIDSAGPANPLSITDGGNDLPLESMTVNVEPIQDPAPYISDTADQDAYNFRAFPASASGANREYETLVGGSVAWNQAAPALTSANYTLGVATISDDVAIGTQTGQGFIVGAPLYYIGDHKYLAKVEIKLTSATDQVYLRANGANQKAATATTSWQTVECIFTAANTGTAIGVYDNRTSDWDAVSAKNFQLIDLTQMFGTTVANSMTVDLFRKYFPAPYYAYEAGSIQSVSVDRQIFTGKNLCNDWIPQGNYPLTVTKSGTSYTMTRTGGGGAFISTPVKAGYTYTLSFTKTSGNITNIRVYNSTATAPDSNRVQDLSNTGGTFTAVGDGWIRFWTSSVVIKDVQLELAGTASAYVDPISDTTITLDHTQLRGLFSIVDGELVADGDEYWSSGSGTQKYRLFDMGSLNYTYDSTNAYFLTGISLRKYGANVLCLSDTYVDVGDKSSAAMATVDNMSMASNNNNFNIKFKNTSYTDPAAFKTAMSGKYILCEVATPVSISLTPYTTPITIETGGTEEFVDYAVSQGTRDVSIPVGHITYYGLESGISANTQVDITNTTDDGSETYTIQLPYPSYGGTLHPLSGLYISKFDIVDFGDLTWYYNATYKRFSAAIDNAEGFPLDSVAPVYASGYVKTSVNDLNSDITMNGVIAVNNAGTVFVRNLSFDDAATFKNAMQGQKIVYESMDSVSFDVTPVEINTALGNNSFSTGTGTISIDYRADTKLYIDNKINALMALISEL